MTHITINSDTAELTVRTHTLWALSDCTQPHRSPEESGLTKRPFCVGCMRGKERGQRSSRLVERKPSESTTMIAQFRLPASKSGAQKGGQQLLTRRPAVTAARLVDNHGSAFARHSSVSDRNSHSRQDSTESLTPPASLHSRRMRAASVSICSSVPKSAMPKSERSRASILMRRAF